MIKSKYKFLILLMILCLVFMGAVAASKDVSIDNVKNNTLDKSLKIENSDLNTETTNGNDILSECVADSNKNVSGAKTNSNNNDLTSNKNKGGSCGEDTLFSNDLDIISSNNQNSIDLNNSEYLGMSDSDKLTAPIDSFTALKSIIDATSSGGTVNLQRSYRYYSSDDASLSPWGIPLQKNIIINGNNNVIDAKDAHCRIFRGYSGYSFTINNLTFINAGTVTAPNILYTEGNGVTFNNCKFYNSISSSAERGGIIFIKSGTLTVNNCVFSNITTALTGGAITSNGTTNNIYNTIFENITASGQGGAFYTVLGTTNIIGSSFIKCTALGDSEGGAIYVGGSGKLNVDACKFIGNVGNAGGALYYRGNTLTISNSYFRDNTARGNNPVGGAVCLSGGATNGGTITNCSFIRNTASANGGAILANKALKVYCSLFIQNYAGGQAGAIAGDSLSSIENSILLNNTAATSYVTAKIIIGSSSTLNYNWWGNTISNYNDITSVIGAKPTGSTLTTWLYLDMDTNVTDKILFRNESNIQVWFNLNHYYNENTRLNYTDHDISNLPPITLNVTGLNGIVSTANTTITKGFGDKFIFDSNDVANNVGVTAKFTDYFTDDYKFKIVPEDSFSALQKLAGETENGGVLNLTHGYHYYPEYDSAYKEGILLNKSITINGFNTTLDGRNVAKIFKTKNGVKFVLNNISFVNGYGAYSGAAIRHESGDLTLNDCLFENFTVTSSGGTIYASVGNVLINNCNFTHTVASTFGSAIWIGSVSSTNVIINGSRFNDASSNGGGGALYLNLGTLTIYNSVFNNTSSQNNGSAIRVRAGNVNCYNSIFANGNAVNGGSLHLEGGTVNLYNSSFINNTVANNMYGGAIYSSYDNYLKIDGCEFSQNSARLGGAIIFYGKSLTISNTLFYKNVAVSTNGQGGAITISVNSNYNPVLTNCSFIANSAYYGGAIFANKLTTVSNSLFLDNYAGYSGGVFCGDQSLAHTIVNSIIINNTGGTSNVADKIFANRLNTAKFNLDYNWWGHNSTNYNTFTSVVPAKPSGSSVLTKWLYLDTQTNINSFNYLFRNQTGIEVWFNLLNYYNENDGKTHDDYDVSNLPAVTLNISSYYGGVTSNKTLILKGGISEKALFNASDVYGAAGITGSLKGLIFETHTFMIVPDDSFAALQKLVEETEDGGILNLNHSYHYYPEYDSSRLWGRGIYKSITINGINTTIDARGNGRVFVVDTKGDVIINNITFVNGNYDRTGTIISHIEGNLTIDNCTFESTSQNSAFFSQSPSDILYIKNSIFNNTKSNNNGGAIFYIGTTTMNIINVTFTNTETGSQGGAILISNGKSNLINLLSKIIGTLVDDFSLNIYKFNVHFGWWCCCY